MILFQIAYFNSFLYFFNMSETIRSRQVFLGFLVKTASP